MPPRKPSFFGLSGLVAIFLLVVAFLTNLATNYSLQEVQFWVLLVGLVIVVVLLDYAERYAAYDVAQRERRRQQKVQYEQHFTRVEPILQTILWQTEAMWHDESDVLEFYLMCLSQDKRHWETFVAFNPTPKAQVLIQRGKGWIGLMEHTGTSLAVTLDNRIKQTILDETERSAFDNTQTALVVPIYRYAAAKTRINLVAVLVVYSSTAVEQSILSATKINQQDTPKIADALSLILSYDYLSGE